MSYFASVMVAAALLSKCFKWDFDLLGLRVMDAFKLATTHNEDTLPKYQKAFRAFQSWVEGNLNKFIRGDSCPDRGEIYGIYSPGEYVAVLPLFLEKEFLEKFNFSKTVIKMWKEEHILDCDPGHRTKLIRTKTLSSGNLKKTRFYCIPWDNFSDE